MQKDISSTILHTISVPNIAELLKSGALFLSYLQNDFQKNFAKIT